MRTSGVITAGHFEAMSWLKKMIIFNINIALRILWKNTQSLKICCPNYATDENLNLLVDYNFKDMYRILIFNYEIL
jgi:hypothetical protein